MGFLHYITGKRSRHKDDASWESMEAEEVLQRARKQPAATYIRQRRVMVFQWVPYSHYWRSACRRISTRKEAGREVHG